MSAQIINRISSEKVIRERTYDVISHREDKKDAIAQVLITVEQLLTNKGFVGQIVINCNGGHINNIQVKETKRV